jgi:RHS repeat-associated protein
LNEPKSRNPLWYTGKPEEEALGLSYFGARWYAPGLGRFMGMDPVEAQAGNLYSFN